MDLPVGKNDGEALGHRYFQCRPKRGTFVFPQKVTAIEGEDRVVVPGVRVKVTGAGVNGSEGTVKFVGEIKGNEKVGVALDEKIGKNDGSVAGTRYFECPQGHGVFVYLDNVQIVGENISLTKAAEF